MKKHLTLSLLTFFAACIISQAQQRVITQKNNENQKKLIELAEKLSQKYAIQRAEAEKTAKEKGWFIRKETDSMTMELQYIDDYGMPQYYTTQNINAARTINTDDLWVGGSSGYDLNGSGFTAGEWDAGGVLTTHQEFGGRATQMDSPGATHYHSTHVAGTIIASGVVAAAKGMAYSANLHAWDWNNDDAEMTTAAAGGLTVANASYGWNRGWVYSSPNWYWYGNPTISSTEDYLFGFYDASAQTLDQIAYDAPGYLLCKSSGNDRNDSHSGGHYYWNGSSWTWSTASRDPDGGADGYDCIDQKGIAKNILTVGAVNDITGGWTQPTDVTMSSFSSWGPTDDGRIKPDLVANGVGVYSTSDGSNTSYQTLNGTSMSTPSVTGTLSLLQDYYHSLNMGYMSAAELKGLAINTAHEAGAADGPDYIYGWGLMNATGAADLMTFDNADGGLIVEAILENGQTTDYTYYCNGANHINVTLCWTDVPGTPPAASLNPTTLMLVNDLDLRVISSGGFNYSPWKLNPASPTTNAFKGDNNRDNVETVNIQFPAAGYYTIRVSHKGSLTNSEQAYAMIVSGMETPAPLTFCGAHSTNNFEYIRNITVAGINQTSGLAPGGYSDYTGQVANMDKGSGYPITLTVGSPYSGDDGYAWADWNQDGDFTDAGEAFILGAGFGPYNGTITVPADAVTGYTTLRIRLVDSYGQNYCGVSTWGETEDYTISVAGTPGLWTGTISTDWTNPANWGDGNVPNATTNVSIPGGTIFDPHIIGGSTVFCNNITILSGAHLYQDGLTASYFSVNGNFNSDLGTFTQSGTSFIYFVGTSNTYWDDDNMDDTYTSVRVQKSLPTYSLSLWQGMSVSETFQVREGKLIFDNNWTLTVTGNGSTAFRVESGGTLALANSQSLVVAGSIIFQDGSQTEVSGGSISCGGNFSIDNNTTYDIQFTGGNLTMNGSAAQALNISDVNTQLFDLTINKASGTCTLNNNNLVLNGNFAIAGGIFNPNALSMSVKGSWSNTVGTAGFTETGSRVIFNAVGHNYILTDETFDILEANMTAALRPGANTVSCNVYDWTTGGIDVNTGTFTALSLADNGIAGGFWLNPGGTINLSNPGFVDLNGDLHIFGGTMNVSGTVSWWPYSHDASIQMAGGILDFKTCGILINNSALYTLTNNITGGTIRTAYGYTGNRADFTPTAGTFELYGTTDASISQSNGSTLNNLIINKEAIASSPGNPSGPIIDPHSKKEISNGTKTSIGSLGSDIAVTSNLDISSGDLKLGGHTLSVGHDCNVSGTLIMWNPADVLHVGTNAYDNLTINSGGWADFQTGTVNLASWVVVTFGGLMESIVPNTFNFMGAGNISGIEVDDNSPLNSFGNVNVIAANPMFLTSIGWYDIVVDGDFSIQAGNTFDMQNTTLKVHGIFTDDPGSIIYVYNGLVKNNIVSSEGEKILGGNKSIWGLLEIDYDFNLTGTMDVGDANLLLHGNFSTATTSTLAINGGTVIADQPLAKSPATGKEPGTKEGKAWQYLSGTLNMSGGLFEYTNNSFSFEASSVNNISGGILRAGVGFQSTGNTFIPTGGLVELNGVTVDPNILMAAGSAFYNLTINSVLGNTTHYQTDISVRNDLTILAGGLECGYGGSYGCYIGGSWTDNVAGFVPNTGIVYFNGNGSIQNVSAETFFDVQQDYIAPGSNLQFIGATTVQHDMILNWKTWVNDTFTLNALLNLTNPVSMFTANTPGNATIANLSQGGTLKGNGGTIQVLDLAENGVFGTVILNNGQIDLYQDALSFCDINGNITISNGSLNLHGTGDSYFSYSGNSSLTMSGGTLDFNTLGIRVDAGGYSFTENITGGVIRGQSYFASNRPEFTPTGGILEMYGSTDGTIHTTGGSNLYNLNINKTIADNMEILPYTDRNGNQVKSTNSQTLTTDGTVNLNGNLTVNDGTFTLSGNTVNCSGNADINGGNLNILANGILAMGDATTISVNNGGLLTMQAFPPYLPVITHQSGYYALNVESGGTISVDQSIIQFLGTNGVYLKSGSIVDPNHSFYWTTFRDGIPGGRLLTAENNQDIYISLADLPTNTWGGAYNAYKSSNVGHVMFSNASGGFDGEAFEYDPNNRIFWGGGVAGRWTGQVSSDWFDRLNWDDFFVPDLYTDVTIPAGVPNFPAINGAVAYAGNLTIDAGASLEVGNNELHVSDTSFVSGQVVMVNPAGKFYTPGIHWLPGSTANVTTGEFHNSMWYWDDGTNASLGTGNTVFIDGGLYNKDADAAFGNLVFLTNAFKGMKEITVYYPIHVDGNCILENVNLGVNIPMIILGNLEILEFSYFIAGNAASIDVSGNLILNGTLYIDGGAAVTIAGDFIAASGSQLSVNNGTFTCTQSLPAGWIDLPGIVNLSNGLIEFTDANVQISGNFSQIGGTLRLGRSLSATNASVYVPIAGLLEFTGTAASQYVRLENGNTAYDLSINRSSPIEMYSGSWLTVGGTMDINSGFNTSGGVLSINNGLNINSGGIFNLDPSSSLKMANLTSIHVNNGGIFSSNGLSGAGNEAIVDHISGYYDLWVESGGTISAEYTTFEFLNTNGVFIRSGSLVDPVGSFNNCTFLLGKPGGRLMTVHNNQDITVQNAIFPPNTWGGAYNVYKNANAGSITFMTASGGFEGQAFEFDPYNRISWMVPGITLNLKVMLEGAFNGTGMDASLNASLPLSQPFNPTLPYYGNPAPDWLYSGLENVVSIPNPNVVDWVEVELRDAPDVSSALPATAISRQAAFLLSDGSVVDLDGSSLLSYALTPTNNLYVVIWHRNHLGVISANPLVQLSGIYSYDFTSGAGQAYGGVLGQKNLGGTGIWGLRSGDGTGDGNILTGDKTNVWTLQAGTTGYLPGDFDMDGQVNNPDKDEMWYPNMGEGSQVPE